MAHEPPVHQGCGISFRGAEVPNYEYRSTQSRQGIPLVHVAFGRWEGGRYRPAGARGLIAVGDTAVGMVAVGIIAVGLVAVGLVSAGIVAAGLVTAGVVAVGIKAAGVVVSQLGRRG
jgi:GLTT repeat (6 copies)